ncbi:MAG TPA: tetratricopeptide repeat protein [Pyrinomonadaceae bacterium]|nr:tetratricopeptide repeat protein [Pyrinomonadaceae bacterium]
MAPVNRCAQLVVLLLCFSPFGYGQVDEICGEFGFIPTLEGPRLSAPFIFGRINLKASEKKARFPKVIITYQSRGSSPERLTVGESGNYCFKVTTGSGGLLVIEIDGVEMVRRQIATLGPAQQREDFDLSIDREKRLAGPGVISSKYERPPNPKTTELYKQAAVSEEKKDLDDSIKHLRQIVSIDAEDYVAWALLAGKFLLKKDYAEAEAALRKAIALKANHFPAWITAGRVRADQKQYEAAIEVLKHAIELEPSSPQAYQLLGESYLQAKQGTLGAEALNKALELDPIGMAECHLQLAHLYQLAKALNLAAREYKQFLEKRPDHPDRKKFEKFIRENLDQ